MNHNSAIRLWFDAINDSHRLQGAAIAMDVDQPYNVDITGVDEDEGRMARAKVANFLRKWADAIKAVKEEQK